MKAIKIVDRLKEKIDDQRPFEGHLVNQIKEFYRVNMIYISCVIEGSKLTELEARAIIEKGLMVNRKPLKYTQEVRGLNNAYDYMFSLMDHDTITEEHILKFHELFYLEFDKEKAGKYRTDPVVVTQPHCPVSRIKDIPGDIQDLCDWIRNEREDWHPVLFAAELHRRFIFIQPFMEGSRHIARLLMNTALIQKGYLPCNITLGVKHEYVGFLEVAYKNEKPINDFVVKTLVETERNFIRLMQI